MIENQSQRAPLPIEEWSTVMTTTIDQICTLGLEIVDTHQAASDKAKEVCRNWKLAERQDEEREALRTLFASARAVVEKLEVVMNKMEPIAMREATDSIEKHLPKIEQAYLTVRHAAVDLLRWTKRSGHVEGSPLPDRYRECYGRLISFSPILQPRLENLQQDLIELAGSSNASQEVRLLLSAVTRYNGMASTARSFIRAIVEPPLDLVFQETNLFLDDFEGYSIDTRSQIATMLNDCCQFLLYDVPAFESAVKRIHVDLPGDVDASLCVLTCDKDQVLFTVDEDPLFGQLTVNLLRLVPDSAFEDACASVITSLYQEFD